jgi:hypothetical protein
LFGGGLKGSKFSVVAHFPVTLLISLRPLRQFFACFAAKALTHKVRQGAVKDAKKWTSTTTKFFSGVGILRRGGLPAALLLS